LTFESSLNHLKRARGKKGNEIYELDFRAVKLKLLNSFEEMKSNVETNDG
jgi:hypothetical protein